MNCTSTYKKKVYFIDLMIMDIEFIYILQDIKWLKSDLQ